MSRACFTSLGGDPFLAMMIHKLFQERFYDEIDKMWYCYNNHCGVGQEVVSELMSKLVLDPKVNIIYYFNGIGNGLPITKMCHTSNDDLVMLLEDDGWIFTPGIVNKCFRQIEDGFKDAGGSPRFSCGDEVGEASKKKYNLNYEGAGDKGPNFWPNFFFCKREDLLKTDLNFASYTWKAGYHCDKLDRTFKIDNHGDTFVWACVQLRAMGLRFFEVPQHHADPFEIENKNKKEMNWVDGKPCWIHGGSLSSGMGGYLSGHVPEIQSPTNRQEIESRVAFWSIASDVVEGFDKFKVEYKRGIENLIAGAKLDRERIKLKYDLYRGLMEI